MTVAFREPTPVLYTGLYALHFHLPPFGRWQRRNHRSMAAHLPDEGVRSVLEVGGGLGRLSWMLAQRYPLASVLSIDLSSEMHELARTRHRADNLHFACQDFLDLHGSFDLVVSAGCWEFLPRQESAAAVARVLAPGGTVVINTLRPTAFARLHARLYLPRYGQRMVLHEPEQLADALRAHGIDTRFVRVNRVEGSYTLIGTAPGGD